MFEGTDYKYEAILQRMLDRIPADFDKRPSSPIYLALAPAAYELANSYQAMENVVKQMFATTSDRDWLIIEAKTYGYEPYPATNAVLEGEFDVKLDMGARFSLDQLNYRVTGIVDDTGTKDGTGYYYYELTCEQPGEIGNSLFGTLIPIYFIPNLTHAVITRVIIAGEDEEDTETFRERFLTTFNTHSYAWNISQYIEEVCAQPGVGKCKILRSTKPDLTMKQIYVGVIITDSELKKPTDELIERVQNYLMPLVIPQMPDIDTKGSGRVAIGHDVWVRGVNEKKVNIQMDLTYQSTYSWERVAESVNEKLKEYFTTLTDAYWGNDTYDTQALDPLGTHVTVTRSGLIAELVSVEGILDVNPSTLTLNGIADNLDLAWDEIPVIGDITSG